MQRLSNEQVGKKVWNPATVVKYANKARKTERSEAGFAWQMEMLAKDRYANFLEILIRISFAGAAGIYTSEELPRRLTIIQDSLSIIFINVRKVHSGLVSRGLFRKTFQ